MSEWESLKGKSDKDPPASELAEETHGERKKSAIKAEKGVNWIVKIIVVVRQLPEVSILQLSMISIWGL